MSPADEISPAYLREVLTRDSQRDADYAAARVIRKLSKLRKPEPGDSLLDVGCSTGVLTDAYVRAGLDATGVDVVAEFVEIARQRYPSARFEHQAAESLDFPDDSFDFVTVLEVLEHVQDWRMTLGEVARVLRPGGVLILSTTNRVYPFQGEIRYFPGFGWLPASSQQKIYGLAARYRPQLIGHTHLPGIHWFTYGKIASQLRQLGMEPRRWLELMDVTDIPSSYARYGTPIIWVLHHLRPYSLMPQSTNTIARKRD